MVDKEYIDLEETVTTLKRNSQKYFSSFHKGYVQAIEDLADIPAAKVSPVRHGRWLYEVRKENVNFRWNVTAECSECCDNRKEIWGGFFPNVPDRIARDVALQNAKQIKLDNYCPNCGVKMGGEEK